MNTSASIKRSQTPRTARGVVSWPDLLVDRLAKLPTARDGSDLLRHRVYGLLD